MQKVLLFGLLAASVVLLPSDRVASADTFSYDAQKVGGVGPDSNTHALKTDTDGTLNVRNVLTSSCPNPTYSVVSLTAGTASLVPASPLSGRSFIQITNSKENTGSPLIKCRSDGTDPVMGTANPGDVYGVGDGNIYPISSSQLLKCTTDTTGTVVMALEC